MFSSSAREFLPSTEGTSRSFGYDSHSRPRVPVNTLQAYHDTLRSSKEFLNVLKVRRESRSGA